MIRSLRNQQQSPLLRLPAELRNKIYGHVLGGFIISFPTARPRHHCLIRFKFSRKIAEFKPSNLLLVCRQINSEAQLLPFELNEFNYRIPETFKQMLDLLSDKQVNAIDVLRMDTSMFYHVFGDTSELWRGDWDEFAATSRSYRSGAAGLRSVWLERGLLRSFCRVGG
jgi:hypothetical protein